MKALELRPLTLGELLDRAFSLYRNHFWLFVGIMSIPAVISIPFNVWFLSTRGGPFVGRSVAPSYFAGVVAVALAFFLLSALVYAMAVGAATYAVSDAYLGRSGTVRGSYGKVRGQMWKIVGVSVVAMLRAMGMMIVVGAGMAIAIGLLVGLTAVAARSGAAPSRAVGVVIAITAGVAYLVGIGLWILWILRYAVSIPALLLENLGVLASIRRSIQLTAGRRWQLFVAIVLCTIVAYAGVIIFQGPFFLATMFWRGGPLPQWLALTFALSGAIGGAITGPLLLIVLVLAYYDTRIRKEAFDLQFMMSSLDRPASVPGIAPAG